MTEAFRVADASPESLTLRIGPRGLGGDAVELFDFVGSAVDSGRVSRITLDASEAELVSLEGVGVLVRLQARARVVDMELRVVRLHPHLERKLRETGTAALFEDPVST